jgi:hypothetical protein
LFESEVGGGSLPGFGLQSAIELITMAAEIIPPLAGKPRRLFFCPGL